MARSSRFLLADFLHGIRDAIPLIIGTAPFGILFGVLGLTSGLSSAAVLASSLVVFAGSAQFIAAKLVADGVGLVVIVATTFIINLRHALYGASLATPLKGLPQRWLLPLGFLLTDEAFALAIRRYNRDGGHPTTHTYHLGVAGVLYVNWQFWTVIGIVAGGRLQGLADIGLDFAMVVTFIGIVVPMIVTRPKVLAAGVAGVTALLANDLPHQTGLLVATVLGVGSGWIAERILGDHEPTEIEPVAEDTVL